MKGNNEGEEGGLASLPEDEDGDEHGSTSVASAGGASLLTRSIDSAPGRRSGGASRKCCMSLASRRDEAGVAEVGPRCETCAVALELGGVWWATGRTRRIGGAAVARGSGQWAVVSEGVQQYYYD